MALIQSQLYSEVLGLTTGPRPLTKNSRSLLLSQCNGKSCGISLGSGSTQTNARTLLHITHHGAAGVSVDEDTCVCDLGSTL